MTDPAKSEATPETLVLDFLDYPPGAPQVLNPPRPYAGETRVTHVVFPGHTNHHGTLFGGDALAYMDSAAFIAATRYCRRKVVTRHLNALDFTRPIPQGTMVELVARVVKTGRTSMTVLVELFIEDMYSEKRQLGCTGEFVLVALGDDGQPTSVPPLKVSGHAR
ncbi:acyl-CoA thioesterase [Deinococcus fonticola]|uniref:acyl-CoA thioesterase n=1 Tax=Deinococcus fonticola TaxID=2528713 RepID=UPI001F0F995A|nr:acyl-CoA thioesterase [Deinococcus fonticola]